MYSHGPGVRRGPGEQGVGGASCLPSQCLSACSRALDGLLLTPALRHCPAPLFVRGCGVSVCPLRLQGPRPARTPAYLRGPQKEGWAASTGRPLTLRRAHRSLQAQGAQVTGTCVPTSLCHLKTHFTKTETRKTSALPTGGTKGQVQDNTPASSLSEEGFCGSVASPPPHRPPSPTSHPAHCASPPPPIPAPVQGSEESTS